MQQTDEILSLLREKYKQVDYLMSYTKEMEKIAGMDDPEGFGAVLAMRQTTMDRIDQLNVNISKVLAGMDGKSKEKIKRILESKAEPAELGDQLETDIFNTNRITMQLLQRVADLDSDVNKKVRREEQD